MVYCFLIHTVCPGGNRLLYWRVFCPDHSSPDGQLSAEQRAHLQKEELLAVARQVRSAVSLSRQASGRVLMEAAVGEEGVALQEADGGVLRLRAGEPFRGERSALWLAVQSLGFTLLCEPHENLLLAEGTLRGLVRRCLDDLRLLGPGSEVLLKSDRIDVLLSRLLPHGQLLFLNHRFAQSLEKGVAAYTSK